MVATHMSRIFFFKQKTAYEIRLSLVGSEMCIRDSLGRDSPKAAEATYCADDQNKYWEYHDSLYTAQESKIDNGWANSERLKAFAFNLNLDMDLFNECLDSGKYSKRVQYNSQQARDNGVRGTPGSFIVDSDFNQKQIGGAQPFSVFTKILDSMI